MHELVKKDILTVLQSLIGLLKAKEEKDAAEIKDLSNHVIHNASVFQDDNSISVAVLVYSLSKIIERKQDLDYGMIIKMIEECIANLNKNNESIFQRSIHKMFDFITTVDKKLSLYVSEVTSQAQVKKGCKLCEHGISVARSSEAMGVTQWEMMQYLGKTTLVDRYSRPVDIQNRLKFARSLFR